MRFRSDSLHMILFEGKTSSTEMPKWSGFDESYFSFDHRKTDANNANRLEEVCTMPLVTISISEGFSLGDKQLVADCVHDALVGVGFAETDRFQKVLRLSRDQFIYDRHHPDLGQSRSNRFVLIEIVIPAGRSREFKKDLLMIIVENLKDRIGVRAVDVMVLFTESALENWAYYGGVQYYPERADRAICRALGNESLSQPLLADFKE